jgi:hypothetical protein
LTANSDFPILYPQKKNYYQHVIFANAGAEDTRPLLPANEVWHIKVCAPDKASPSAACVAVHLTAEKNDKY